MESVRIAAFSQYLLLILIAQNVAYAQEDVVTKPIQMSITPRVIAPFEAVRLKLSIRALPEMPGWLYDNTVDPIEYLADSVWIRPLNSDRFTKVVVAGKLLYSEVANDLEPQQWPTFDLSLYEETSYSIPLAMVFREGGDKEEKVPLFSESGEYEIELRIPVKSMTRGTSNPARNSADTIIQLRSTVVVKGNYPEALANDRSIQKESLIPYGSVQSHFDVLNSISHDEKFPRHSRYAMLAIARRLVNGAFPYIEDELTPIEFGDRNMAVRHVNDLVDRIENDGRFQVSTGSVVFATLFNNSHRSTLERVLLCRRLDEIGEQDRSAVVEAIADDLHISIDDRRQAANLLKSLLKSDFAFAPEAAAMWALCVEKEEAKKLALASFSKEYGDARVWVQSMRYRFNTFREWRDFRVRMLPEESRHESFLSPSPFITKKAFRAENREIDWESFK